MTDQNVVTACLRVDSPETAALVINKWRNKFGGNITDSRIEDLFQHNGKLCVLFTYRNCLSGTEAKKVNKALIDIARRKTKARLSRLSLVANGG